MAVDSVDFVQAELLAGGTAPTYTVPPLTVAVLTDIDISSSANAPVRVLLKIGTTVGTALVVETLYSDALTAQWHGRRVFQAGEVISFIVDLASGFVNVAAGGYLYT